MSRYLIQTSFVTLIFILFVGAYNYWLDPYLIFETARTSGVSAAKPYAKKRERIAKMIHLNRSNPHTVILGNSRMQRGYDPEVLIREHQDTEVYNSAVPGGTIHESRLFLLKALEGRQLKRIIIGAEFEEFLRESGTLSKPGYVARYQELESYLQDRNTRPGAAMVWISDRIDALASIQALLDSTLTWLRQSDPSASNLTRSGFNDLPEVASERKASGHYNIFRRNFNKLSKNLSEKMGTGPCTGDCLKNVEATSVYKDILRIAKENDIEVVVLINPYHAGYLELLHELNLWPSFEEWKHHLLEISDTSEANVTIWDFSGYASHQTEPVPPPNDKETSMIYHVGPGHFSKTLGTLVLNTILDETSDPNFGTQLASTSVTAHLKKIRKERTDYLESSDAENCLNSLARSLGRSVH